MTQEEVGNWIQTAAVVIALAAVVTALIIGMIDRRSAQRIAAGDRRFQHLLIEEERLERLLANYNRDGSTDLEEAGRMASEALSLIGMIGPDRLPRLWASHVDSDEALRGHLADPEMPDYKKEAIRVQLVINKARQEIRELA